MRAKGCGKRNQVIEDTARELREAGAWVVVIAHAGSSAELEGRPTLLVGLRGQTWLANVAPGRAPTAEQRRWAKRWPGGDVLTVATAAEALAAFGLATAGQDADGHSNAPSASQPAMRAAAK